jgi:zinc D-Ala-D-Ala carboxypeptidase
VRLSPHFTLDELTVSETAKARGIPNTPDSEADMFRLRRLALGLEWVRQIAGGPIRVNSAYRNARVNALVGGVENSDHRDGDAADIWTPNLTAVRLAQMLARDLPVFDQLILETSRNIVHVSFADRFRRQVLTQKTKGAKCLPGIVV